MKKVLFVSFGEFPPFYGGIAFYIESIIENLKNCQVFAIGPFSRTSSRELPHVKIIRPRLTRISLVRTIIGNLTTLLKTFWIKPDYILITDQLSLKLSTLSLKFQNLLRFKSLYFLYGTEIEDIATNHGLIDSHKFKKLLGRIDKVIVISEYVRQIFKNRFPDFEIKTEMLYPTLDSKFEKFKVTQNDSRSILKRFGLKESTYIMSVGRLVKRKGHEHIISVFPQILKKHRDLKYVIVGEGEYREELEKLTDKLGLKKNVKFVGNITEFEKKALLKNSLFYAQPSAESEEEHQRVEGFGIVLLEAFSQNKAVIANNHGGMPEVLGEGKFGILTDVNNSKRLSEDLLKLIEDSNLRKNFEEKSREAYSLFSRSNFKKRLDDILKIKPKIAFVVEWFLPIQGGAGNQALEQAKNLRDFDITIYTRTVRNTKSREEIENVPVVRVGRAGTDRKEDYRSAFKLFKELRNTRNELIHVHGNLENNFSTAAIIYSKLFRKPVIGKLAIHGELSRHLESDKYSITNKLLKNINVLNWIRRTLARKLDLYLAISKSIQNELREVGIPGSKVEFVPNGIDIEKYSTKYKEGNTFLVVSRLARHKGIVSPLLKVWTKEKLGKNHQLLVLGSGEDLPNSYEREVKEFVRKLGDKSIKLLGKKKAKDYYPKSNILIVPSESEGLSNALLEASASGLPAIVSNISGNVDIVADGKNGYVFEKESKKSFSQKINKAIKEKNKWETMGKISRKIVEENYSITKISRLIAKIYNRFI